MNGSSSRYWSSLSAWPEPKSPTRTRSAAVHIMASLRKAPGMASPQPLTPRQPDPYSLSKRAVRRARDADVLMSLLLKPCNHVINLRRINDVYELSVWPFGEDGDKHRRRSLLLAQSTGANA